MHPGRPCARRSLVEGCLMCRPPQPPLGRMDNGIRGHAAAIVDREKQGEGNGAERKGQSVVGCVGEGERREDARAGGRLGASMVKY